MMLMSSRNRSRISAHSSPIDCCAFDDPAKGPRHRKQYRRETKKAERRAWRREVRGE